ncbi:MAG TPA: prepilin-type N-terminal cleavage/methylation domain-containing protein [Longimicrobiales bacterium]|nr:prepilin-type N-terminal cleavage/methylation domain-containing protein [Longimicrobiales bacterium]
MLRMLTPRAGFTLAETLVALVLTAVIGAAVTGAFISQSQFFDTQEKVSFARGVSRGAMNLLISELRMVERTGGIPTATVPTNKRLTVRVPYAMGVVCDNTIVLTVSRLPADPYMISSAGFSGYAWRGTGGVYTYVDGGTAPIAGSSLLCNASTVTILPASSGGAVISLSPTAAATIGAPVLLYQTITYEFKASTSVPGRTALWRRIHKTGVDEELVAPFDTTAKFRFFVNDAATAQDAAPTPVSDITGIELTLDGMSERPNSDGTFRRVPLKTSVFFRNRLD